ncbi:MAG: sialidase family protein [Bryobacteraceae bacterium]
MIELIESHVVYENPKPHVRSRHGYFPGMVKLRSGELLCLFILGEAFEAANSTTYVTRSRDGGRTWDLQGPLYDKRVLGVETNDSLKATQLRDGSLVAVGYRFLREDPEQPIGIAETGGTLPGEDLVSFSRDEGRTWEIPTIIPHSRPEMLEISGPCIETSSGDLVAVAPAYKMADGSNPSGQIGMVVRSRDKGRTWDDSLVYYRTPENNMTPLEARICEMQPGRLAVIVWAYDYATDRHHPNHIAVSHDDGHTWSAPINTGHMGQASGICWMGGDRLLTIHAHRAGDTGIYVRMTDFAGDEWRPIEETVVWGKNRAQTREGQPITEMFASIRFGQPSLTHLEGDEYLATHWAIEEGQGRIRTHRLRIRA